jgi:hypothetical protein
MTNQKIIEGLIQCQSLLTSIRSNPYDAFAAASAKETLSNAIRWIGEFTAGAGQGKLADLKRVTIVRLYVISKNVPAGKLCEPAGEGPHSVPLDEVIDRIGLFLCLATENGESLAHTGPSDYYPAARSPSGFADALPPAGGVL